ncbi:response regulator transcription factor [Enterobacter asburiae]|jgi:Response regulator containing a CheY-like receiver domain and an HTH DNA-binding domain|nr:response regulator transcription factor [Enterobacter asburiae]
MAVKIAIADEHTLIRRGVYAMMMDRQSTDLDGEKRLDLTLSGEAATTSELVALLEHRTIDILLLGYTLSAQRHQTPHLGLDGLALLKWLKQHYPALKVIVLSSYKNPLLIRLALEAGAKGYLSRSICEKTLYQTLKAVNDGEVYVERTLMSTLFQGEKELLSPRETEVIRQLCKGLTLTQVSLRMHLSIKTVSAHKIRAMEKLGVTNDCQLYCLLARTRMFDIAL